MSKQRDDRSLTAEHILPRELPMPRFDYQRSNSSTNAIKSCDEDSEGQTGPIKIKSLQNLRFAN